MGGETEALQKLQKFAAECRAQPNKGIEDGGRGCIYGANFSCKISPWLATGCLSPRYMFDELKKSATRYTANILDLCMCVFYFVGQCFLTIVLSSHEEQVFLL